MTKKTRGLTSRWVETTQEHKGREVLFPVRCRVRCRGRRITPEAWSLGEDQTWRPWKRLPSMKADFDLDIATLDRFALAAADAMIESFAQEEEKFLALLDAAPLASSIPMRQTAR